MFWLGFRMFCILLSCFYCVGRFWNVWIHFGGFYNILAGIWNVLAGIRNVLISFDGF